jgi:hypothetical protein
MLHGKGKCIVIPLSATKTRGEGGE